MTTAFTLNAFPLSRAIVRIDRYGIPRADVWLPDDVTTLAEGQLAVLTIGDLTIVGTLRPGGVFGASSYWTLIGGAGKWDQKVDPKAYRSSSGVRVSQVASDLAAAVGETRDGDLVVGADRSLGNAWTRDAGLASCALDAVSLPAGAPVGSPGQWWVDVTGVTNTGPRPARAYTAPSTLTVRGYNPATKFATLVPADDAVAALLPGCVLTHPDITGPDGKPAPLTIGSVVIRAEPGRVEVDVCGEKSTAEMFADITRSLATPDTYARTMPMQVIEARADGTASALPGDALAHDVPGLPLMPQIPGVPGCTAVLATGAIVLVAWPGADPARPTIVAYDPTTLPASLAFDAATTVTIGGGAPANPIARGDLTDSGIATVIAAFNALCIATGNPSLQLIGVPATGASKGMVV